jgi:hypothetical protein
VKIHLIYTLTIAKEEIDNELKNRKEKLDRMCSLELLAAIEARIRIDYLVRCTQKKKDIFSKKLREIYRKKSNKAKLIEDILCTWSNYFPEHKSRIDKLNKAIDLRNWLAHGRYWLPKKSPHIDKYDYLTIYLLAADILSNINFCE